MKKKVCVLGGGIAGLTAAYELTNELNWQDKYDITIYQMGWRCGGKATSGVGKNGRIEEVGVHIFQGWYHNAFRMVKEVYHEINEKNIAPENPFKSWQDAFIANPYTFNVEYNEEQDKWKNWPMVFPNNNYEPGTELQTDFVTLFKEGLGIFFETLLGSPYQNNKNGKLKLKSRLVNRLFFKSTNSTKKNTSNKESISYRFFNKFLKWNFNMSENFILKLCRNKENFITKILVKCFKGFISFIQFLIKNIGKRANGLRRTLLMLELGAVCLKGVFSEVYNSDNNEYEWDKINKYDFREWLVKHGATNELLDFAIVRFIYYGTFGNVYGGNNVEEKGKIGADIGIKMITRIPSYKGCFVYYLAAGTGGTFIAPLALVLKNRGVKFKYFHKVTNIKYSDTDHIEEINFDIQVELKNKNLEYNPFVIQNGIHQWTSKPDYSQIEENQAQRIQENNIDLESNYSEWNEASKLTLTRGNGFDIAIVATSVKPLKHIAKEILKNNTKWTEMVSNIATTPTLNVQFWLNNNDEELGFNHGNWGMEKNQYANTVIYEDYLYSWTSMTYIEKFEKWKNEKPRQISYWCGVWPENLSNNLTYNESIEQLKEHTGDWMNQNMQWFWPKSIKNENFDYNLLCSQKENTELKFHDQFFQLNVEPAKQYVLGRPGTNKFRMKPDETGYQNLFFAGDWTDFGLNVGYMEGTVQSGILCANGIKKRFNNETGRTVLL
ncbi:MAG: NAD(P)-binding protein [Tenacibaculum sp.]|nr:NAD(P)-binding protein [Tenacibaculum sp.]